MEAPARSDGAGGGGWADERESLLKEVERLQERVRALEHEKADVCSRLEFVEDLVGPTEAQRRTLHDQAAKAREAALQARRGGAAVPVRFAGRLDEQWLRGKGLSERDCALLQRGCVTGSDGIPRDVSLLGDPAFRPFDEKTKEPLWEVRGGALKLSLGDVKERWGEQVALEVVRCAIELERYDASRRLGVELPWHEDEGRELEAAEVIGILERELAETKRVRRGSCTDNAGASPMRGLRARAGGDVDSDALWSVDTRSRWEGLDGDGSEACGCDDGNSSELDGSCCMGDLLDHSSSVQEVSCCSPRTEDSSNYSEDDGGGSAADENDDALQDAASASCVDGGDDDLADSIWVPAFVLDPLSALVAADADVEHMLHPDPVPSVAAWAGASGSPSRKASRAVSKALTASTPPAEKSPASPQDGPSRSGGGDVDCAAGDERFADVLRELLEGEAAESIGRWLMPAMGAP